MAEAIVGPLVGRLQELALGEARALVGVNDDIQKLRDKLMWLQAFLREADAKRRAVSDEVTKVWVLQTRDAVFDAEDALDHYYLQLDKSRYPRWARPTMRCVTTFTTQAHMRHKLARKIERINTRLEDIIQNKHKYKIDEVQKGTYLTWKASTSLPYTRRKMDDLHESNVRIYEKQQEELEKALIEQPGEQHDKEQCRPMIITVYGKSGVGKTTLVRDIYNEMAKKKHFDVQAMECFAPYLSATNIIQQIVQQLTEDNRTCRRSEVMQMFKNELEGKKYLLVIDGEVSSTEWKNILDMLPSERGKDSKIVHITQSKPEEPPSGYHQVTIKLRTLDEHAAMTLFQKRLLRMEEQDQENKDYQKELYHITEGLPLAIVLLSGLIRSKERGERPKVFQYLKSLQSYHVDNIMSVCFDDLPQALKCCLLYFSAFPPNITIEARILVSMWVAEGFLTPQVGKSMEKIGYFYLKELIARNLVNLVQMDDDSSVGNMFVTIQNKVHDFLQFEAHEASFIEVHSGDDVPTLTSARRLSLQNYTDKYAILAKPLPKLRSIFSQFELVPIKDQKTMAKRSKAILFRSPQQIVASKRKKTIKSHIKELFHGSEFLRVINIQGIEIGEKLTHAIGNVVHLQFLGITSCSLEHIPSSIGRLTNLQTLDVRETNVRELPNVFWTIKTLRHVFGFILKLPKQIGNLKQLQTLDSIKLEDFEQTLDMTLGEMIHLEHLVIWSITNGNVHSLPKALTKLESLWSLILHGKIVPSSVFTTLAFRRLKYMVLDGELLYPSDLNGMDRLCLPNLIMLSLKETNVNQEFINKLAELPCLATLALGHGSYMEKTLVFSSAKFQCLKKLKVDVKELEKVQINLGMLPKLKEWEIHSGHTHQPYEHEVSTKECGQKMIFNLDLLVENAIEITETI
uniref:AAA+ ATPase domain-containing protein n=1 Tax=Leersia perrieri TaxID=77586 RepID=A0A0D9WZ63_9ORYZ